MNVNLMKASLPMEFFSVNWPESWRWLTFQSCCFSFFTQIYFPPFQSFFSGALGAVAFSSGSFAAFLAAGFASSDAASSFHALAGAFLALTGFAFVFPFCLVGFFRSKNCLCGIYRQDSEFANYDLWRVHCNEYVCAVDFFAC